MYISNKIKVLFSIFLILITLLSGCRNGENVEKNPANTSKSAATLT